VHRVGSIRPCSPSSSRSPQDIGGCPGKAKVASGSVTNFPSPQIEHPCKLGPDDGDTLGTLDGPDDGYSLGNVYGTRLGKADGKSMS